MADETSLAEFIPERPPNDFFRFLIADDEEVARKLLRSILQAGGYTEIDEADSGEAAMQALTDNEYHVVLLDKNMPGQDGLEVLEAGSPKQKNCEFIMITAYGSMETAIKAMDAGAYSYVTKPFSEIEVIGKRIEGALERIVVRYQNEILVDRLRMVVEELDRVNGELEEFRRAEMPPKTGEHDLIARVHKAIEHLRKLAGHLQRLRQRTSGKAGEVIAGVGMGVDAVANLLEKGEAATSGSGGDGDK